MSTLKERAVGTAEWARDESVSREEVAAELAEASTNALLWKAAQHILTDEQVAKVQRLAEIFVSLDYDPK